MTKKSEFNADEWALVVEAPMISALRVIAADRGGTLRESLSLSRAYAEARKQKKGEFLDDLIATPPQVQPSEVKSPDTLAERGREGLGRALALVDEKATPEEAEDYRHFILDLAGHVARAHKEGGFLGIGGKEVSESEQTVLDELAQATRTAMPG